MRIQKTSQYIEGGASLSNVYGTSNENGYTQDYINGLETYSTTEKRIGTWCNGKPLYRKCLILNTDFSTWQNVSGQLRNTFSSGLSNVSDIWLDESASYCRFSNNWVISINNYNNANDYIKTQTNISNSNIQVYVPSAYSSVTATILVTIKYTKTTDTVQNTRSINNDNNDEVEEPIEDENQR